MNFAEIFDKNPVLNLAAQTAQQTGIETYVVGGFVRDLLLKRPSKDIDLVCVGDGNGIVLAEKIAEKHGKHTQVAVFQNFGTAQIKIADWELEFVGARKESYQRDSRKPLVENGTLADDQLRRDFTINAMAISLQKENFGDLIDPFNGIEDLQRKIIKTPLNPDITFSDDPLRMMRAARFASQLGFDIFPDTFEAMQAMKDRINIVSMERIADELNKIILSPTPSYGFKMLHFCGLLEIIFPEFVALQGAEFVEGKGHKDNFFHTLQVLDNVSVMSDDLWLRWAAVLHDIAKPATKRFDKKVGWTFHGHEELGAKMTPGIFRKMKLPLNEKMKFVQKLVRLHLRPIALVKDTVTDSALRRLLFDAGEDIDALMMLCKADITSKNYEKVKKHLANFEKVQQKLAEVEEQDKLRNFQPVITGEIIMQTFNIPPGREVGKLKEQIREAILEGEIRNEFEEGIKLLLKLGKTMGLKAPVTSE
ncbi:MAG: HD domain-containing protein [Verrucomicrobia bacterium]|nr:HD domain-containing protein [Cytophagales bacterium]